MQIRKLIAINRKEICRNSQSVGRPRQERKRREKKIFQRKTLQIHSKLTKSQIKQSKGPFVLVTAVAFLPNLICMVFGYKINLWFGSWDPPINEVSPQFLVKQLLHVSSEPLILSFFYLFFFLLLIKHTDQNNL